MCRVQCTQPAKRQQRHFGIYQCLLTGHSFSKSRWEPVFAKFCQRHPWKRVALALSIQMTVISTFNTWPFSVLWKFPLLFSCQFWKSCTKDNPGVFIDMWLTPSPSDTQIPVLPRGRCMTSGKVPNLSDPQFLDFFQKGIIIILSSSFGRLNKRSRYM